jgi:hypothetical protein
MRMRWSRRGGLLEPVPDPKLAGPGYRESVTETGVGSDGNGGGDGLS